jgi:2-iminobutanoate/2-iminopropanoate deaminase
MKKNIQSTKAPAPIGPYSQAIQFENLLFTSGQIAIDSATGKLLVSNITDETELVMKNLQALLKEAGMNFDHVLKCSIFIANMNDFGEINAVYARYFNEPFPARETVEVARLPKDVNVEISLIACKSN